MAMLFPVGRDGGGIVEFAHCAAYTFIENLSLPPNGQLAGSYHDRPDGMEVDHAGPDRLWSAARVECSLVQFRRAATHKDWLAARPASGRDNDPGQRTLGMRLDGQRHAARAKAHRSFRDVPCRC